MNPFRDCYLCPLKRRTLRVLDQVIIWLCARVKTVDVPVRCDEGLSSYILNVSSHTQLVLCSRCLRVSYEKPTADLSGARHQLLVEK